MFKIFSTLALGTMFASFLLSNQVNAQEFYDGGYASSCCEPCPDCDECECQRFWVDAEYLYWTIQCSREHAPLLISGTRPTTVLGDSDAVVVLGRRRLNDNWRSGGRFAIGYWFDDERCYGAEVSYWFLPSNTRSRCRSSDGTEFLAVPFIDANTGNESSTLVADPGSFSGVGRHRHRNFMQNAEVNALANVYNTCSLRLDGLLGFRYWNFEERFRFHTSSPLLSGIDVWETRDRLHSQNNFYGGQLGFIAEYVRDCFFINLKGKIALGATCRNHRNDGRLRTNDFSGFDTTETFDEGYFIQRSNRGRNNDTKFCYIPEVDVNLGYDFTNCFRVFVGYTFIYISEVIRPARQFDRVIDPTQSLAISGISGDDARRPHRRHRTDSLWIQGVNVGLEYRF
jgi:hypothetical protein